MACSLTLFSFSDAISLKGLSLTFSFSYHPSCFLPSPCLPLCTSCLLPAAIIFTYFFSYIYLVVLGLSCSMWDLVQCSGIEPRPRIGSTSLSHWTTREVQYLFVYLLIIYLVYWNVDCMRAAGTLVSSLLFSQVLEQCLTQNRS